jgi:hypothetical protein
LWTIDYESLGDRLHIFHLVFLRRSKENAAYVGNTTGTAQDDVFSTSFSRAPKRCSIWIHLVGAPVTTPKQRELAVRQQQPGCNQLIVDLGEF